MFQLIAAGASLLGGVLGAQSANRAAKRQEALAREGMEKQEQRYQEAKGFLQPYMQSGQGFLKSFENMYGVNGVEGQGAALQAYKQGPSYALLQDVIGQAAQDTQGTMASQGLLRSGAYGQELTRRISPLVLQDYYNYAGGIERGASQGRAAASSLAGYASQQGGREAQGYSNLGAIQASGIVGANNAMQQGLQGALAPYAYGQGMNSYPQQQDINSGWTTNVTRFA